MGKKGFKEEKRTGFNGKKKGEQTRKMMLKIRQKMTQNGKNDPGMRKKKPKRQSGQSGSGRKRKRPTEGREKKKTIARQLGSGA